MATSDAALTDQADETGPAGEAARVAQLVAAEAMALELFDAVVAEGLIRPGRSEQETSDAVAALASDMFGVERWWHKRIVRAGPNTLHPYRVDPPDLVVGSDDVVFLDFGPVFEAWEADLGRTYVLGEDPRRYEVVPALEQVWRAGRDAFAAQPDITGAELYARMGELAEAAGWEFGGEIAGHLVGRFPHEKIAGDKVSLYIAPGSDRPMRALDAAGHPLHWILEVHLVDRDAGFGGFYEQLLDIGPNA